MVAAAVFAADSTMMLEATAGIAVVAIPRQITNAAAAEVAIVTEVPKVSAAAHMVLLSAVAGEVTAFSRLAVIAVAGEAAGEALKMYISVAV